MTETKAKSVRKAARVWRATFEQAMKAGDKYGAARAHRNLMAVAERHPVVCGYVAHCGPRVAPRNCRVSEVVRVSKRGTVYAQTVYKAGHVGATHVSQVRAS